jgi:translation initiation factor RLI1
MKNNDNLKEKEIKQEKSMDKNELESVSGGFLIPRLVYVVDQYICTYHICKAPLCAQHCCHGAVKYYTCGLTVDEKWFKASIDQEACTGCFLCKSEENCPHGAITQCLL